MWRSVLAAVLVYAYGHPFFDGYRPAVMDRALQAFYSQVNQAAYEGRRVLLTLDETRAARHLKTYIDRVDAQVRSSEPGKGP